MILKSKKTQGFTLIELLVVIAIIGVLASVIVMNLTSTKDKSANAGVKANLTTVRSQAEIYYTNNNYSYGTYSGQCPSIAGSGNVFVDSKMVGAINSAKGVGGGSAVCWANGTQWSVAVQLKSPEGISNFWCVDSTAAGKGTVSAPSGTICP